MLYLDWTNTCQIGEIPKRCEPYLDNIEEEGGIINRYEPHFVYTEKIWAMLKRDLRYIESHIDCLYCRDMSNIEDITISILYTNERSLISKILKLKSAYIFYVDDIWAIYYIDDIWVKLSLKIYEPYVEYIEKKWGVLKRCELYCIHITDIWRPI